MKTVTLWCETGKHNWERPSQRGRRPVNCPEHTPTVLPIEGDLPPVEEDPLAKARAVKSLRKQQREALDREKKQDEIKRLRKALPKLNKAYDKACDEANAAFMKVEKKTSPGPQYTKARDAWYAAENRSEAAMNAVIQTSRRIRVLEAELS